MEIPKSVSEELAPTEVRLDKDFGADTDLLLSLVPPKMGFKIGEVSKMLGLKNHVLRYWETEFPSLKPKKSNHNQRVYTVKEIEMLIRLRKFLYVDKFSISGARKALREVQKGKKAITVSSPVKLDEFKKIYSEIEDLKRSIINTKKVFQ